MQCTYAATLMLLVAVGAVHAAGQSEPSYANAVTLHAGGAIVGAMGGTVGVSVGYERRLCGLLSVPVEIAFAGNALASGLSVASGVTLYPGRAALHGWYVGASASAAFLIVLDYRRALYGVRVHSGYQWVSPQGLVLAFAGGIGYVSFLRVSPGLAIAIGIAF